MKIVLVNLADFSKSEGGSIHQASLASYLIDKNYDLKILTPKRKGGLEHQKLKKYIDFTPRFGNIIPKSLDSLLQIPKIIKYRFKGYKILYSRINSFSFIPLLIGKLIGYKVIVEHNTILSEERRTETKYNNNFFHTFDKFSQILSSVISNKCRCVTEQITNYLLTHKIPPSKISTIGNGSSFLSKFYNYEKYYKYKFDKKKYFYIGYAGSLSNYEGLENFINCVKYCKNYGKKKLKFLIVGDGPNRLKLENLVIKLGLVDKFDFIGYVQNSMVKSLIENFDISVAPLISSRNYETGLSSIKIRDYCACKSAILTSHIHEHIQFKKQNLLYTFHNDNPEQIAEALMKLVKSNKLRKILAVNAYKFSLRNFSWNTIGNRIEKQLIKNLT